MDKETSELLDLWGFGDYTEKFKDEEIDINALEHLTPELIRSLIPKIGRQAKFIQCQKKHFNQKKNNQMNPIQLDTCLTEIGMEASCTNSQVLFQGLVPILDDFVNENTPNNQQLQQFQRSWNEVSNKKVETIKILILQRFRMCLSIYKNRWMESHFCKYTYTQRSFEKLEYCKISKIVVTGEMNGDCTKIITPARMKELAQQICTIFPEEKSTTYYIERQIGADGKPVAPKGTMYHTYNNLTRTMRQSGIRPSIRRPRTELVVSEVSQDIAEAIEFLKTSVSPWNQIVQNWSATFKKRRDDILLPTIIFSKRIKHNTAAKVDLNSIQNYMNTYPALQQPQGIFLLQDDFNNLYPEVDNDLLLHRWQRIVEVIKSLYPTEDLSCDYAIMERFALLFDPFTINAKGKTKWRPSKQEIVDGFVLHVKVISDLESSIQRIKEKLKLVKKTLQPTPIVVDNENGNSLFFVMIENVRFHVSNLITAIDLCYKSYHALHAEYPVQSVGPWLLLQKGIYKMTTQWDPINPTVERLLSLF